MIALVEGGSDEGESGLCGDDEGFGERRDVRRESVRMCEVVPLVPGEEAALITASSVSIPLSAQLSSTTL